MTVFKRSWLQRRIWLPSVFAVPMVLVACSSFSTVGVPTVETPVSTPTLVAAPSPTVGVTPPATETEPATPTPLTVAEEDSPSLPDDPTDLMLATLGGDLAAIARKMAFSGNQSYIPVLLEFFRFQTRDEARVTIASYVNQLAEGSDAIAIPPERVSWAWWTEWLGRHPEVKPPEGFAGWKGSLYSNIDPGLGSFLYDCVKSRIRLEEIVWGGVAKDGIPDLINPPVIAANDAGYLQPSDRVFGVSFNGEHRAYPLRILNPHEMANDVVGGVPFALAY